MKEELTREVLEAMKKCEYPRCGRCGLTGEKSCKRIKAIICNLSTTLLEELDKPKVWDGAPDGAGRSVVHWYLANGSCRISDDYTRRVPLPKTRARIKAEEIEAALTASPRCIPGIEIIESLLNKYEEELKGES